jgi:hypothetical protein
MWYHLFFKNPQSFTAALSCYLTRIWQSRSLAFTPFLPHLIEEQPRRSLNRHQTATTVSPILQWSNHCGGHFVAANIG